MKTISQQTQSNKTSSIRQEIPHQAVTRKYFRNTRTYTLCFALALFTAASVFSAHFTSAASAATESLFKIETISKDHDIIWGIAFLDDTHALFTEKSGAVYILDTITGDTRKIYTVPEVFDHGQGGLLDVAVSPDYRDSGWIYFTYAKKTGGGGATTLARTRFIDNRLQDWQDLFVARPDSDSGYHFGSRIAFDDAGHVYFSAGERGNRENGQDLASHPGSIFRLNLDGTVPRDNPFTTENVPSPIWSYGHRNPQGLAYDKATGRLWSNEHGPRGGDEINLILPGNNYGWPIISHGKEYWGPVAVGEATSRPGYHDPVKVYIPSIAPGSLLVYSGQAFPKWQGNLFSGALKLKHLNRVELDETGTPVNEERLLTELGERIRALAESPEGFIYFSTDSGKIFRMTPLD